MVGMVMGKTDCADPLKPPSGHFDPNLRAFAAVDQDHFSANPAKQGSQSPVGERHHSSAAEQTYINHQSLPLFLYMKINNENSAVFLNATAVLIHPLKNFSLILSIYCT
ncbi:hypothetical protein SDC9_141480 [bioreactor metagenome]|uniref:Uncharacterized protein n=1 Tax=bioreactor metagenome TaxID=1076179 RepID=A0A645DXS8_9ZZZZ